MYYKFDFLRWKAIALSLTTRISELLDRRVLFSLLDFIKENFRRLTGVFGFVSAHEFAEMKALLEEARRQIEANNVLAFIRAKRYQINFQTKEVCAFHCSDVQQIHDDLVDLWRRMSQTHSVAPIETNGYHSLKLADGWSLIVRDKTYKGEIPI